MDRLASYAAREAASESAEEKQQKETDAAAKMLDKMKLSNDTPSPIEKENSPPKTDPPKTDQPKENGNTEEADGTADGTADIPKDVTSTEDISPEKADAVTDAKPRGILEDVRLYEIFYDQVVKLVNVGYRHLILYTSLSPSLDGGERKSNPGLFEIHNLYSIFSTGSESSYTRYHCVACFIGKLGTVGFTFFFFEFLSFCVVLRADRCEYNHRNIYPERLGMPQLAPGLSKVD